MKQQQKYLLKIACLITLSISFNSYSQGLETECGEDFHGTGHAHQDCVEDIIITSTEAEGSEGTKLAGIINSEGKVTITPGFSKVRIVFEYDPEGRIHRTKVGNGGHPIGGRNVDPNLTDSKSLNNSLNIYPNPVLSSLSITSTESNLISYEVYSIDGRLLLNKTSKGSTNYTINLERLTSGLHLLKLHLKNGDIINKHIIKQ